MFQVRRSSERGHAQHGWLDSFHTFSFGSYRDPKHIGFRALRVINEDRVAPGKGFETHSHRDMEILSYVLEGALEHKDSMGNGSIIRPGELQLMRAGTGVTHSEFNHSNAERVHFLQIWIIPDAEGLEPAYDQRVFPESERRGRLRLIASRDGADGSVLVRQDVRLYATLMDAGDSLEHDLAAGRFAWVQVAKGELEVGGETLGAGDGVAISDESAVILRATSSLEALLFDLG